MIAIGCDHGALELKEQLIEHLKKRGVECKDYGTYTKDSCDYPVYAKKVAEAILSGECGRNSSLRNRDWNEHGR